MKNKLVLMVVGLVAGGVACMRTPTHERKDSEFYYDDKKTKLKMKGSYMDGREIGEWVYFNYNGDIEQKGVFEDGKRTNKWNYYYKGIFDTIIIWSKWQDSLSGCTFSLPDVFGELKDEHKDMFLAKDSLKQTVFSIKTVMNTDAKKYYEKTIEALSANYNVNNNQIIKLTNPEGNNYYVAFYPFMFAENSGGFMSSAYFTFHDTLIDFSYTCALNDSSIGKILFGDIIQASYRNEARLASPLDKINKKNEN